MPSPVSAEIATKRQSQRGAARLDACEPFGVGEVDLVGGGDTRQESSAGLYAESSRSIVSAAMTGSSASSETIHHVDQQTRPLDVAQKTGSPALPLAAPWISRDIRHYEAPVGVHLHHAQVGGQCGEGVGGDLGPRGREGG